METNAGWEHGPAEPPVQADQMHECMRADRASQALKLSAGDGVFDG